MSIASKSSRKLTEHGVYCIVLLLLMQSFDVYFININLVDFDQKFRRIA